MPLSRNFSCFLLALVVSVMPSLAGAAAPAGHFSFTSGAEVVLDTKTGRTWQRFAGTTTATWNDANAYCSSVVGATLGGTGWRLPTVKELLSLVDYSVATGPMIDTVAFPSAPADRFWSANVDIALLPGYVDFGTGRTGPDPRTASHLIRCVR